MKHLKTEFDKLTFKEFLTYMLAILCIITGTVAVYLSLYIPPVGEVHNSVLTYFGICSTFSGMLLGISMHYNTELNRFKSKVTDMLRTNAAPPDIIRRVTAGNHRTGGEGERPDGPIDFSGSEDPEADDDESDRHHPKN